MSEFLQYLLTGLATGATYALVGLGIALIVQVTGVINFAQGDFVMLGALLYALVAGSCSDQGATCGSQPLAAVLAVVVVMCVGALVNVAVIQPARRASTHLLIILTIGASIVIQGAALVAVGTDFRHTDPFTSGEPVRIAGASLPLQYLWVFGVTTASVIGVWFFLTRTRYGIAMRATAMDAEAARMVGISPRRMSLAVFVLAAGLGAIGGVVLAPLQPPNPQVGIALGLRGFTAAVVGGLDNPAGAIVGGLLLGVVEALAGGYLGTGIAGGVAYLVLIVALLVRPTGILRPVAAARV